MIIGLRPAGNRQMGELIVNLHLQISGLSFTYGGPNRALRDVNLTVHPGEVVGLVGPNGSGKSTLVKNIFDLVARQSGRIEICGFEHCTPQARNQSIHLAGNDFLPEYLTGREYITLLGKLYGMSISNAEIAECFARYGMPGREVHLIEDYSHGMRKKTQLIAALLARRPLTVIDETLNGIDIEALHLWERQLNPLKREGLSVLLCTHDFSLLERVADRIVFLDGGRIISDADASEIRATHGSISSMVFAHLDSRAV